MIENNKIYFFRVGEAQYIYGKNSNEGKPYWCMKYENRFAIDTGRNISECKFPVPPKDEQFSFETEEDLFEFLDNIASDNLDHVMWGLTPTKWVKPCKMQSPISPYYPNTTIPSSEL